MKKGSPVESREIERTPSPSTSQYYGRTPRFFDLIHVITSSNYFVSLPSRTQGPATCKLVSAIDHQLGLNTHLAEQLRRLREVVVRTYSQVQHDGKAWDFVGKEWYLVPLTVAEARKFLAALQCDEVIRHLVVEPSFNPGSIIMSHEMVVTDGTERARLFLARLDLPVHYHLPVTYAQLGTREVQGPSSELLYSTLSTLALRRPSAIDKELRQLTLARMWFEEGTSVLHLRADDYVGAGAPEDSVPWKVIRKLAFPVAVKRSETPDQACSHCLVTVVCWISSLIKEVGGYETSDRIEWLYRDGKPGEGELSVVSLAEEAGR